MEQAGRHRALCLVRLGWAGASALLALSALTSPARADTFTLDLGSTSDVVKYLDRSASTALWNVSAVTPVIQAPLAPSFDTSKLIDFGDGSDGAFSDGPAQPGISISGSTITFDTSVRSDWNFTSFNLSAGETIQVAGPAALTIRVLGATTIAGTLSADGTPGTDNNVATPLGGSALAGGYAGGDGGVALNGANAGDGLPSSGTPNGLGTHGTGVSGSSTDQGGGGGCAGSETPAASAGLSAGTPLTNAASCASSFATREQAFETQFDGGAGGGGGGGYNDGFGITYPGAGGGAGGGAIHLISLGSVTIQATGVIEAKGGAGGVNNASVSGADCGGAGGGGSGGSIWIQSASTVSGGTFDFTGGAGGVSPNVNCAGLSDGGSGGRGAIRIDSSASGAPAITTNPATLNESPAPYFQVTNPTTGTYELVSRPIDFSSGLYDFGTPSEGITTTGACGTGGTLNVLYEGSNDGATWEKSVPGSQISELNQYAYLRIRVQISPTSTSPAPPCLTSLSIPYSLSNIAKYSLAGGMYCGSLALSKGGKGSGGNGGLVDLGLILLSAFFAAESWRFRRRPRAS